MFVLIYLLFLCSNFSFADLSISLSFVLFFVSLLVRMFVRIYRFFVSWFLGLCVCSNFLFASLSVYYFICLFVCSFVCSFTPFFYSSVCLFYSFGQTSKPMFSQLAKGRAAPIWRILKKQNFK
jgi:hypothetical protein